MSTEATGLLKLFVKIAALLHDRFCCKGYCLRVAKWEVRGSGLDASWDACSKHVGHFCDDKRETSVVIIGGYTHRQ